MNKGFEPGCVVDVLIFGLLAYVGHPTWWLEGGHGGPGLIIILPAYYFGLAAIAMVATAAFKTVARRAAGEREKLLAAHSTVEKESFLRAVLSLYCVIGLLALFLDTTRPTMPSGLAYGIFVACDVAQFLLFMAIFISLRRLKTLMDCRPYVVPAILTCSILISLAHYASLPEPRFTALTGLANTREEEMSILATGVVIRLLLIGLVACVWRSQQVPQTPSSE